MIEDAVKTLAKGPNFGALTTMLPSGQPHTSVMWVDCTEDHILINTELGRRKLADIESNPLVTVAIWDKDNPYHYAEVRGRVDGTTTGPEARAHIDQLSNKYHGRPYDPAMIKTERIIVSIAPERQRVQ